MMISIHALLAESDFRLFFIIFDLFRFLSTLSLRRATSALHHILELFAISIHALLAESDTANTGATNHGQISIHALLAESDLRVLDGSKSSIISIHALLAESDPSENVRSSP